MSVTLPFTAIVGQDRLKMALLLVAVDPKLGGLLIAGPRGSAKSTMVRSLSSIMENQPFVTLPLGATEEMISGSFDLEAALNQAELKFNPGLLNQADGGILYVDEVNLLPDHLVDLLLDTAASGITIVERDGISHQGESRFSLVGTMNPDEGELRPQLLDRFGLMVEVQDQFSINERERIARMRIQFDDDPETFIIEEQNNLDKLKTQIKNAIELLPTITINADLAMEIARRCEKSGADGMRADITLHRAARTHAALQQRKEVTEEDINQVEKLVLVHRIKPASEIIPPSQTPPSSQESEEPNQTHSGNQGNEQNHGGSSIQGSWGAIPGTNPETMGNIHLALANASSTTVSGNHQEQSFLRHIASGNQGIHHSPIYHGLQGNFPDSNKKIDWRKTLRVFHAIKNVPQRSDLSQAIPDTLRFRYSVKKRIDLNLVLLDTSASTFSAQGFSYAKGALLQISKQCYLKRRYLGMITFGNNQVELLLPPQRAPKDLSTTLDKITAGGGTPASKVLEYTRQCLNRKKYQEMNCHIYLVSDGRVPPHAFDHPLLAQYPFSVIDIERNRIKLGMGKQLANRFNGNYIHINDISESVL